MISKEKFNELKVAEKVAEREVDFEQKRQKKNHAIDSKWINEDDFHLNRPIPNQPNIDLSKVFKIFLNPEIQKASNVYPQIQNHTTIPICFFELHYAHSHSLTVKDIAKVLQKLIKLGRKGIEKQAMKNLTLANKKVEE